MSIKRDLRVRPIDRARANLFVKKSHYSGKVVISSQLHLGVFWRGVLRGVMQFGSPLDRAKALFLVPGTKWNAMLELNRMALGSELPRNSESRSIAIALRKIRIHRPDIEWVQSYADATQCGDGTIYRAAGFLLVGMRKNSTMLRICATGETFSDVGYYTDNSLKSRVDRHASNEVLRSRSGGWSMSHLIRGGVVEKLRGFQLRYVKFLDPRARARLAVEPIPYAKIAEVGASMYLGKRAGPVAGPSLQVGTGGASPTPALFSQPGGPPCGD